MTLQIGFIGLKGHQDDVVRQVAKHGGCRIAAVCDDDTQRLAGVSSWGGADAETKTFSDPADMFEKCNLDIVVEAGTDNQRGGIIKECARRGIHVLCEKPLACSMSELDEVREALDKSAITLSMMLTMRYDPTYLGMKAAIAAGGVGEVCLGTMQKSYRLGTRPEWQCNRATFAGIIPFVGIHALDLIYYTTGRHFIAGAAFQNNTGHPAIHSMQDNASIALELDNGGSASVRLDYCRPQSAPTHGDDRLRIAGNEGVIESLHCGETVKMITAEGGENDVALPEAINEWEDFLGYIDGGSCVVPVEDCLYMTEVVLRLNEAAAVWKVAKLPSP